MRKTTFTLVLISFLSAFANAQSIDEYSVVRYFNSSLSNGFHSFDDGDAVIDTDIASMRENIWDIWKSIVKGYDEEKLIELDLLENRKTGSWQLPPELEQNATMPYYFGCNEYPALTRDKYPLFLYMHGSGDKNQEWETGIGLCLRRFYSPAIYFVPQIPNAYGEYYRWAIQSKQWAWEKLLRLAFVNDNVDANKIYFFGISEGGYGSQRLASFYADYLAGAGPMAGGEPLKNAPMENVANIAFSLRTGELDDGFGRNLLTRAALNAADSLASLYPGHFNHFIEVIPGYGHSIDYQPTTPWLSQYTRDPHPDFFIWENYDMYGRYRTSFYNLQVIEDARENSGSRACYEYKRVGNTINLDVRTVEYTTTYTQGGIPMLFRKEYYNAEKGVVRIYLNEDEFDLSKPVTLYLNGWKIFEGKVQASVKSMIESCALFYDPERLFPAALDVDIANYSASTAVNDVAGDETAAGQPVYDISGKKVNKPEKDGIYIINDRKVLIK